MKNLLAKSVSILFINGELAVNNGLRKFKNPSSLLVIFLIAPFNKSTLFFKGLITFIISFISLFVRIIFGPVIDEIPFSVF